MGVVSEDQADWHATPALCKPQDKASASAFTQNPELIGKRYDALFLKPLGGQYPAAHDSNCRKALSDHGKPAGSCFRHARFRDVQGPRRIVLVSDLLQNSEALSFYRGDLGQLPQIC